MRLDIPIGSQHIALLEPVRFVFETENEKIIDVRADVGYVHRGVEKACEDKFKFKQVGYVVARVCGLCAITHASAYTFAVEQIMNLELNTRIKYLRIMIFELDRIHSHLLCLAHTAENAGYEALFMRIMKERELIMRFQDKLTGNRVQFDYVSIGGVNRDLDSEVAKELSYKLKEFIGKVEAIEEEFLTNYTLSVKYKNVGVLTLSQAKKYNCVGPMARAAGLKVDVRTSNHLPYSEVGFELITSSGGDIFARNVVRLKEIKNSLKMILNILDGLPEGEIQVKVKGSPKGEAYIRVEAPRGELFYYVRALGGQYLDRVKIRTPTFALIPSMVEIFKGSNYADSPAILASFDPCMSCTAK